jgi:hypothetical protein
MNFKLLKLGHSLNLIRSRNKNAYLKVKLKTKKFLPLIKEVYEITSESVKFIAKNDKIIRKKLSEISEAKIIYP